MNLAYLQGQQLENHEDEDYPRTRTATGLEKREGAVYDDLDLGLEPSEDVRVFLISSQSLHDSHVLKSLMKAIQMITVVVST